MSDQRLAEAARRLAAAGVGNPRLDARLLWTHAQRLSLSPAGGERRGEGVFGDDLQSPPDPLPQGGRGNFVELFESLVSRRAAREPLAYITGHKEFWSLDFHVAPGVLVPRPESETIIEQALATLPDKAAPLRVLDLGVGSGCLLISFLKEFRNACGLGVDSSEKACAVARHNAERLGVAERCQVALADWRENISDTCDVILANPPYIRSAEIAGLEPEVSRFEPAAALDGGPDGLSAYSMLAPEMTRLLRPGGLAFVEIGSGQEHDVSCLMRAAGLGIERIAADLAGIPRVLVTIRLR